MVAKTEVFDMLKSIGLNLYERKIFVALLAKGVATAAELSELANVPRSRSYDVLQSLADKGFVMVQPSKPIKYVSLHPQEALERTKQIKRKEHKKSIDRIENLGQSGTMKELVNIYKEGLNLVSPSEMTGTLKGNKTINRQIRTLLKSADNNISIMTTEKGFNELYDNHFRILKKVAKNGVKMRILTPGGKKKALKSISNVADVRNMDEGIGRFTVVDNNSMLFALTDDNEVHETQDVAFWAKSRHAVNDIIKPYFKTIWKQSK